MTSKASQKAKKVIAREEARREKAAKRASKLSSPKVHNYPKDMNDPGWFRNYA